MDFNTGFVSYSEIPFYSFRDFGKVYLRKNGRKPYLVPADVYRPAAIDQLKKLGEQLNVPVFPSDAGMAPVDICQRARVAAQQEGCDTLLLDTAGRLHIDEALMEELRQIKAAVNPSEILLIADAMTGQDAVNIAQSFDGELARLLMWDRPLSNREFEQTFSFLKKTYALILEEPHSMGTKNQN